MHGLVLRLPILFGLACGGPAPDDDDDDAASVEDTSEPGSGDDGQGGGHGGGPVDRDGDGVPADEDCDDADPRMPVGDEDCDGTPTEADCDDTDPGSTIRSEDADCDGVPNSEAEAVCYRWSRDRSDLSEGSWDGSVATCDPGTTEPAAFGNALRLVNLFRWLSGLPEVGTLPELNERAQDCALIMHAYGRLTHYPAESFACYTESGAQAAAASNISPYAGVYSVDLYMSDPGNATTLGHRRWILSNGLGPIGLGSTSDFSCMLVIGGSGSDRTDWTAWPPPGIVPFELTHLGWATLDETGWSVQSDTISLRDAAVTITRDDGANLPVVVTELLPYYGSLSAISMVPSGWEAQAGRTYAVHIEAAGGVIDYTVELVDCDALE
ncbi:MAG: CAP domain-containing protein [Myxococcota bacterium]|nr:CAP domain-containing protein [Myxococcota bacterium]